MTARFWSKVDKSEACWLWTASTRNGYGQFYYDGAMRYAHRYAYETTVGNVPSGMVLDHTCRERRCVNPAHLQVVTPGENNENHSGPTRRSKSGVRGVWWDSTNRKWVGQVRKAGRAYSAGHHSTREAAAAAVLALRNDLHTNNLLDRASA